MPLGDVTEQMIVLDSLFGVGHASAMPSSHTLDLYTGNPYDGGVPITGPGYAPVTVNNDATWPDADTNATKTALITFPAPTGAWDDAACWVLRNGSAITAWEFLDGVLEIDAAGDGPVIGVTIYVPNASNVGA